MRTLPLFATATLGLTLMLGCQPPEEVQRAQEFENALPTARILASLPEDTNRTLGETSQSYLWTRGATQSVNGLIGAVILTLNTITDLEPTYSSETDEYVWGPWDDGGLDPNETALYVRNDGDVYAWAIIKRAKGSTNDADWVPVVIGEAAAGSDPTTASGGFIIDFDANAALEPGDTNRGIFASNYTLTADGVSAEAGFEAFTDGSEPARDALYTYEQDDSGAGAMDLALSNNFSDGEAEETIVLRSRWMADGQGRGDAVIFGGDLGDVVVQGSECWNSSFSTVFESNNLFGEAGDATACAFEQAEFNEE